MHTPHITLPAGKTQSSVSSVSLPGGAGVNSVIFEDQAGAEEIAVTGSYDLHMVTANNKVMTVGNASTTTAARSASRAAPSSSSMSRAHRRSS